MRRALLIFIACTAAARAQTGIETCKAIAFDVDAVACYARLIDTGSLGSDASAKAHMARGRIYAMDLVEPGFALADLNALIRSKPKLTEAYRLRGFVHYGLGQYAGALADFDEAIALQPASVEAAYLRAETLFEMRKYDSAIAAYAKAVAMRPALAESLGYRREDARQLSQLFAPAVLAKADNDTLVKPGDDVSTAVASCNGAAHASDAPATLKCAKLMLTMAEYEQAVLNFRLAFPVPGEDWEINRGHGKSAQGFIISAGEQCDRLVKMRPDMAEAWYVRGRVGYRSSEKSHADLDRAIALKPDYAEAHILRAIVKHEAHDAAGAKADAEKARQILGK